MKNLKTKLGLLLLALVAIIPQESAAQDASTYFMPDAVARSSYNPALAPERGYFALPLVGNTQIGTFGNLTLDDLLYIKDDTLVSIFDTSVLASESLPGLNRGMNTLGLDGQFSILSFGSYTKNGLNFWSVDLGLRTISNMHLPYELFNFFKTLPPAQSIQGIEINSESYLELGFNFSRPIGDRLVFGARVKALAGLARAKLSVDQLDVALNSDVWSAQAYGTLELNNAGIGVDSYIEGKPGRFELSDISMALEGAAGYGAAIDLGVSFDLLDNLQLSASINDIGFISWSEESSLRATVANNFVFDGVKTTVDPSTGTTTVVSDANIEDVEFEQVESKAETAFLQANMNLGAEYRLWNNRVSVGALYSARFWRTETIHSFTPQFIYMPFNWLSAGVSYSLINNDANALGFAANISTGFINIYLATDILMSEMSKQYVPIDQANTNFTLGIAFPLGGKTQRAWSQRD